MSTINQSTAEPLWDSALQLRPNAGRRIPLVSYLGYWLVLSIPLTAAVIHIHGGEIAGLNLSGWAWSVYFAAGLFVLIAELVRGSTVAFAFQPWLAFLGILWISLLWTSAPMFRGMQDALQITSPILMAVIGSIYFRTRDQLDLLMKLIMFATVILTAILAGRLVGLLAMDEDPAPMRVLSITITLSAAVMLAHFPSKKLLPVIGWGACLFLTLLSGSRMATFAVLAMPIFHPAIRGIPWRIGAIAVGIVLAVVLFHTPQFQQRFFVGGSGTIEDVLRGDFLTFGRLEHWPDIWAQAWQQPIFGAGVGSTYVFVPTVWEDMFQVHNDYLRIFFEIGLVGLAIWVIVLAVQWLGLLRRLNQTTGTLRIAFVSALLGLFAFVVIGTTDNILIYNLLYTNPLFLLIGAAYGVHWHERMSASHRSATPADDRRVNDESGGEEGRR